MISTTKLCSKLTTRLQYSKIEWKNGNPYNMRWNYRWKNAYYTYPKDQDPTYVKTPEQSKSILPPFYSTFQDVLFRTIPALKTYYQRSDRYQDKFQMLVLPAISLLGFQGFDLHLGFKALTVLPMMLWWTRVRDRCVQPQIPELQLREILHGNPEITELFKVQTLHVMDYDAEYDKGFPCEKKFPEFKNKFFRFFNNDTHMCSGSIKFGDLESGATMTVNFKTMPIAGEYRYQVGEPFYFYDLRCEIMHNGQFKEVVLADENQTLKDHRPFLIII